MDLKEIRNLIDSVDDELVELYIKRMELCKSVGLYKKDNDKSVNDSVREKEIVYRLSQKCPEELRLYLKEIYKFIFYSSKALQSKIISKDSKTKGFLDEIVKNSVTNFPIDGTVACQGVFGANSSKAIDKMLAISSVTYFKTFEGVFNAVEKGLCEFGVLPIENSTAGTVSEVYDLMRKYNFHIVKSVKMQIDHALAVKKGSDINKITKVISHHQAISQCSEYLKSLNVKTETVENTAIGAKLVSEGEDNSVAVICSIDCAEAYGLEVIENKIQNNQKNYTRFICITKDLRVYKGADKISVMTSLEHEPGSLNRLLSRFYSYGLNLTKLESRPIEGSDFEFMFYLDFEGDILDDSVRNLIAELENNSTKFKFLGAYKEGL